MPNHRLRRARERARLSQAELADQAGVSRQLIGNAEAGRHAPAVNTGLRIAGVLGESVEALFGTEAPAWSTVHGAPLRDGQLVVVGRVGERLCASPLEDPADGEAGWPAPDGVVEGGEIRLLPGANANALVVVGCDPVLGLCERLLSRGGARRVVAVSGSTGSASPRSARTGPTPPSSTAPRAVCRIRPRECSASTWPVGASASASAGRTRPVHSERSSKERFPWFSASRRLRASRHWRAP